MLWEHLLEHKNKFILIDKDPFCHTLRILKIFTKFHQKCAAKLEIMHPRRPRGSQSGREKRRDKSF